MSDCYPLSTQQFEVISALSAGASLTAAAAQAGVHRNTVTRWRRNLIPFQHALADAQYDRALHYREQVEELVDLAVSTLQEILTDPLASASVRLRAALAVMQIAVKPPEPKKQVELLLETVTVQTSPPVHNSAQRPIPATPTAPPSASPVTEPPATHNSAQPQPIRRTDPKTGRNELCPCGSGKKFKRCCLDSAPLSAAA